MTEYTIMIMLPDYIRTWKSSAREWVLFIHQQADDFDTAGESARRFVATAYDIDDPYDLVIIAIYDQRMIPVSTPLRSWPGYARGMTHEHRRETGQSRGGR